MTIELDRLSPRELDALISQAKKRKSTLGKRKPVALVRRKVIALAKAEGYSIDELFGSAKSAPNARKPASAPRKPSKQAGKKVAPKYRNPANPKETWAGRGQQPRWLSALTAKGKKVEDFLIR
jgi:DNA-binding protein H-NS